MNGYPGNSGNKVISEIFLTRLLSTKVGYLLVVVIVAQRTRPSSTEQIIALKNVLMNSCTSHHFYSHHFTLLGYRATVHRRLFQSRVVVQQSASDRRQVPLRFPR